MNNAGRPLDKLTFDELKRILKFPVLDETGSRIGIVDKIYVDQKKMKAKAVEILMDNGKHKKVSASKLVYIDGVVVFSKNGRISLKKAMVLGTDVDPLIRKARELLDEVRIVKKRIHMLDDLLVQGKITETTFKVLPPKEELREEPKVKLDEHTVIKPVEEESGEEVVIDQVNINEKEYEDKKLNVEVKDLDKIL